MLRFFFLPLVFLYSYASFAINIAYVNYSQIEQESLVTKNVTQQIQEKQKELQSHVESLQTSIQGRIKELEKSASVLTAKALEQKKVNFQKELIKTEADLKKKAQHLESVKNEVLTDLNTKIKVMIEKIAKKKDYDLVLSEVSVVYVNEKHDITPEVLKKLNKKIPSIKIDWEEK